MFWLSDQKSCMYVKKKRFLSSYRLRAVKSKYKLLKQNCWFISECKAPKKCELIGHLTIRIQNFPLIIAGNPSRGWICLFGQEIFEWGRGVTWSASGHFKTNFSKQIYLVYQCVLLLNNNSQSHWNKLLINKWNRRYIINTNVVAKKRKRKSHLYQVSD